MTCPSHSTRSLCCLPASNKFRIALLWFVEWRVFTGFILVAIAINCGMISLADYRDPGLLTGGEYAAWDGKLRFVNALPVWSEPVFTVLFTIEAILKIIAYGLYFGELTYLKNGWNVLDCIVVSAYPMTSRVIIQASELCH